MKIKIILGLSLVSVLAFSTSSHAQFAPGSSEYAPLASDLPAVMDPVEKEASEDAINDNPCPEPKRALGATPDDLAKIQEDITRFTLCVQRAQLLERLNELAESNIETIDSALNLTVGQNDGGNAVPGIMPSIPMPPLPASVSQMLTQGNSPAMDSPVIQQFMRESNWKIRNIQGKGGSITAQLVDAGGAYLKISKGGNLPNNGGEVLSITNTSVRVNLDGKIQNLKWIE
ncbi:MAG: hypothetical protein COB76_00295 [Alphaproteobacteria bacterium]|nr:MAG: hypothetical protein COB76_00295 [Alphaproteobacteria bacterium]